jgi:8-amino-7-oxononanoate synthase
MAGPLDWLDDAVKDLERRGLRRTLAVRSQGLINFGANDYLGLAADPRLAAAARRAIEQCGWGSGASPLVTGRTELHAELERKLAEFEGTEAALLFPTGYAANAGTIAALVGKGDVVCSDELNHASIIDGCRLSGAAVHVYPHRDLTHLRQLLRESRGGRRLIVTDSLFSMTGDLAPLAALCELAERHECMLLVDEAHATGVFGPRGRGVCEVEGVEEAVSVRVGTLSKAFGSLGGFVAGPQRLIDWLTNRARPYVFSTAAPAAVAAAGIAALDIVQNDPERRTNLLQLAEHLRRQLLRHGLSYGSSFSQIVPVVVGDPRRAVRAAGELRSRGYFVPAIRPPSVPEGQSLLRISLTALHTEEQVDDLVAALAGVVGTLRVL